MVGLLGGYAIVHHHHSDDCLRLADHPQHWQQVQKDWSEQQIVALVRHAADCDPDKVDGCVNGNETLIEKGRQQAKQIGLGVSRTLGGDFKANHSYLHRTRETAQLAFGESAEDVAITKPCKDTFQHYVESFSGDHNQFFVTHSSCLNALKSDDADRLLGFNASKDRNFGIAAIFKGVPSGKDELLGCVWPSDWARLPDAPLTASLEDR